MNKENSYVINEKKVWQFRGQIYATKESCVVAVAEAARYELAEFVATFPIQESARLSDGQAAKLFAALEERRRLFENFFREYRSLKNLQYERENAKDEEINDRES